MAPDLFRSVRFYARVAIYTTALATVSTAGVFTSMCMAAIGKKGSSIHVVARMVDWFLTPLLGVKVQIEGHEYLDLASRTPCVVIANHQSIYDVCALGACFPKNCTVMAKREFLYTPLFGQMLLFANAVMIDRGNHDNAMLTFAKVAETMKVNKTSLFIFPEGTRNTAESPSLLPFKKGAFHLAVQGQIPIIPVVFENHSKMFSSKKKNARSGTMIVKALPPIETKGFSPSSEDTDKLLQKTEALMLSTLEEMADRPGSCSSPVKKTSRIVNLPKAKL